MIRIIEKIVDYYLTRSIDNQVIILLMWFGAYLTAQSVFGLIFEEWLRVEYGIEVPNLIYLGVALIIVARIILYLDIKYYLLTSMFNTVKTSRCNYLGNQAYQFVFDKKMRCAPTICIVNPKENSFSIKKIDESGFIIHFEKGKEIPEIQFWADAWDGLNLRQRLYIWLFNIFRPKNNKIERTVYEDSYAQRKIDAIDGL